MPAEAPRAYNFTVVLRVVLRQHVGDLRSPSSLPAPQVKDIQDSKECVGVYVGY